MDFMKDIVNVSIRNVTGNTNVTDLNTILIVADHDVFTAPELYRVYTEASQAKTDGFAEESYVHKSLQLAFSQEVRPTHVLVSVGVGATKDYNAMFERMLMIDEGWLWLISDLRDTAKQVSLAEAVQAEEKMYAAATSDVKAFAAGDETDLSSQIKAKQLGNTFVWFDDVDADVGLSYSEIAVVARCSAGVAGSVQFLLKLLVGITTPASVDTKTKQRILTSKGYTYAAVGNKKTYSYGSGETGNGWIDINLAILWIKVGIREDLFNLLTSEDKLPMEDVGASAVESRVRSRLMLGQDLGIIAKDTPITVTVPKVSQMTPVERSKRELPRVKFSCRLNGAIISVTVNGEVFE